DFDRIEEASAHELGAGDQRLRRADILLQQMKAIDRRLVFRAVDLQGERRGGVEQPDAKPLAAAVWLQDDRAAVEMPPCRGDKILPAGDQHGPRRMDAGRFERGILPALADLEVER